MRFSYKSILLLCSILLASCAGDDEQLNPPETLKAVEFNAVVVGAHGTRATGSSWDPNDNIGIYMKKADEILSLSSVLNEADNVAYTTEGDGRFKPGNQDNAIFLPNDGTSVDFIAYYPQKEISGFMYKVDITNQSSLKAIDLL